MVLIRIGSFSLWCMIAAPLMAGNDLRAMTPATIETLTNPEVIAVDQDPLGVQGATIWNDGNVCVWAGRPLFDGSQAVLVFNQGRYPARNHVEWEKVGFEAGDRLFVRDLWRHETTGPLEGGVTVTVEPNDIVMLRVARTSGFPLPPIITADTYRVSLRVAGEGAETLTGHVTLTNKGTAELPLWKVRGPLPAWLSVKVSRNGKSQVFTNTIMAGGLKRGTYHAVVRADNVEPVSGRPMSAVYYDVDLEVGGDAGGPAPTVPGLRIASSSVLRKHVFLLRSILRSRPSQPATRSRNSETRTRRPAVRFAVGSPPADHPPVNRASHGRGGGRRP